MGCGAFNSDPKSALVTAAPGCTCLNKKFDVIHWLQFNLHKCCHLFWGSRYLNWLTRTLLFWGLTRAMCLSQMIWQTTPSGFGGKEMLNVEKRTPYIWVYYSEGAVVFRPVSVSKPQGSKYWYTGRHFPAFFSAKDPNHIQCMAKLLGVVKHPNLCMLHLWERQRFFKSSILRWHVFFKQNISFKSKNSK